jgi:hypothetical protein
MPVLEASRRDAPLPAWLRVRQRLESRALPSPSAAVASEIEKPDIRRRIRPGMRVAVAVGSRGIRDLFPVVQGLVEALKGAGAAPFVIPAMGSHGGGTAEGQAEVLAGYGITEKALGVPIRASMETVQLGEVRGGVRVFADRIAAEEADAVVPVARVKPHTHFRGEVESGLHKMLSIGLGKHRGASSLHTVPIDRFADLIPTVGQFVLSKLAVPFGIAIVEDGHEAAAVVEAVPREAFLERERELLRLAKAWLPRLPFDEVDVLLVREIGKNISGAGMDPNVTGRYGLPSMKPDVHVARLVVLGLTEETHGNAAGIGVADVTTRRVAERIDWHKTYTNHVAAGELGGAKLPLVADSDREAVAVAAQTIWGVRPEQVRLAWIRNTLELGDLMVSLPLWKQIEGSPRLAPAGDPRPIEFDAEGRLIV